jgi:hypothetical protein
MQNAADHRLIRVALEETHHHLDTIAQRPHWRLLQSSGSQRQPAMARRRRLRLDRASRIAPLPVATIGAWFIDRHHPGPLQAVHRSVSQVEARRKAPPSGSREQAGCCKGFEGPDHRDVRHASQQPEMIALGEADGRTTASQPATAQGRQVRAAFGTLRSCIAAHCLKRELTHRRLHARPGIPRFRRRETSPDLHRKPHSYRVSAVLKVIVDFLLRAQALKQLQIRLTVLRTEITGRVLATQSKRRCLPTMPCSLSTC